MHITLPNPDPGLNRSASTDTFVCYSSCMTSVHAAVKTNATHASRMIARATAAAAATARAIQTLKVKRAESLAARKIAVVRRTVTMKQVTMKQVMRVRPTTIVGARREARMKRAISACKRARCSRKGHCGSACLAAYASRASACQSLAGRSRRLYT